MNIFESNAIEELKKAASFLADKGWSEASGGNISMLLDDAAVELIEPSQIIELEQCFRNLSGKTFAVTGTGCRMRDVAKQPGQNISVITISQDGLTAHVIAGNNRPTSELPSHLYIYDKLMGAGKDIKTIVHTHPVPLITLTHLPEKEIADAISKLQAMMPEVSVFIPEGAGYVPFEVPGSYELAKRTADVLLEHRIALWEKHGAIATGKSPAEALDYLEIMNKAAEIFLMLKSMGAIPNGLSSSRISRIQKAYGVGE